MVSDAEILWPSDNLDDPELPILQHIRRVLATAVEKTRLRTAVGAVLKQFEGEHGQNCPTPRLPVYFGSSRSHKQVLSHVPLMCVADEASVGPLLCTVKFQEQQHGAAQHAWQMPDFDSIGWYGQTMAALAAATVFGKLRR